MRTGNRLLQLAVAAVVLAALASVAEAEHSSRCEPHTQYLPPDAESRTYPVYVAMDDLGTYFLSVWIYAEWNSVEGLQRDDDYCHHTDPQGNPYTNDTRDLIIY